MDDKNKNNPESPTQPTGLEPVNVNIAGSEVTRRGLGIGPSKPIHVDISDAIQGSASDDENNQPTDDSIISTTASAYVGNMGELFDEENSQIERPQLLSDDNSFETSINDDDEEFRSYKYEENHSHVRSEPTLDQRIDWARIYKKIEIMRERNEDKTSRVRHNFGTDFHIAAKYPIHPEEYGYISYGSQETYEAVFEQLTSNRKLLYGYLQHLGMCIVDDTGRDPDFGDEMDLQKRGFLMLPAEIEHADFFAFEDVIRERFPFSDYELKVKLLEAQKIDPSITIETLGHQSTPEQMRELVDSLALDERFTHLFEKAELIRSARKEKPRAGTEGQVTNEQADLPTFAPSPNKHSKWR